MPPGHLPTVCSKFIGPGGGPEADPGHARDTMSLWPRSASEYSLNRCRKCLGRGKSGQLLRLLPHDLVLDKAEKCGMMDGRTDGWTKAYRQKDRQLPVQQDFGWFKSCCHSSIEVCK